MSYFSFLWVSALLVYLYLDITVLNYSYNDLRDLVQCNLTLFATYRLHLFNASIIINVLS